MAGKTKSPPGEDALSAAHRAAISENMGALLVDAVLRENDRRGHSVPWLRRSGRRFRFRRPGREGVSPGRLPAGLIWMIPALGGLLLQPEAGTWVAAASIVALGAAYLLLHTRERKGRSLLNAEIADRVAAEKKLIHSVGELARSNRELDDFAYIASHDLKEPLRGISSYSRFLLEDYAGVLDDEGVEMLRALPDLTGRMEKLIEELLHYSRVGRVELAREETDLNAVLDEILLSLAIGLDEKKVELRKASPLPVIVCDRVRIGEVFRNLITNAMKYNDSDSKWIEIGTAAVDPGGRGATIYVKDNGIGIPPERRDDVFTIFRRLHGRNEYGGGTGAGMSIARRIVERHHGKIWFDSTEGEGTTFYFSIGPGVDPSSPPAPSSAQSRTRSMAR